MPSFKTFRLRIRSVQSTQKITKAMKMVAAAKLRRAQEQAMAARPYAEAMDKILASLGQSFNGTGPRLLAGTGSDQVHLLIVATADRGLCGAFNSSIVREARRTIRALLAEGKTVKVLCVGRKGRDQLRRDFGSLIVETITDLGRPRVSFADAQKVTARVMEMFAAGEFDVASVIFNRFKSAMTQIVTAPAAHPAAGARGRRRPRLLPRWAARSTSSSRTRRTSWPTCCRATSPSRSSARCWRMPRASSARR